MGRRVVEADLRTRRPLGMGERVEGVAIEEVDAGRRVKQEQPSLTQVFKTAQSLAGEVAATTGDDGGGFVFSCLKDVVGCE
nr:pentatricopeptide repeat-containing protein At5g39710 [Ipomoea trifida]